MTMKSTRAAGFPHRFTVGEYYAMGEAGILAEFPRTELIEGDIVDMTPIGPSHSGTVDRIAHALFQIAAERVIVRVQSPILLNEWSLPQPDVALLRFRADYYTSREPVAADILLVVEVAVTTLSYDRDRKLPLYARAGIGELWIVEPEHGRLTAYHDVADADYRSVQVFAAADEVSVHSLGLLLRCRDLIGEP